MVINNTQREPYDQGTQGAGNGRDGRGNNPLNRQTEAFSNTRNRGEYFGMNEGRLIQPDQNPGLTAIEEARGGDENSGGLPDDFGDSIGDDYEDEEEGMREGEVGSGNSRGSESDKRAETAIKQAQYRAEKEGDKSQFFQKLAQRTWISTQKKLKITRAVEEAKKILSDGGEKVSTDELIEMAQKPKEKVSFPLEIFLLAITKDILDGVTEVGGVTTVIGQIVSIIVGVILFFWTFSKVSGWFSYKKRLIKSIFRLLAGTVIVEFLPFIRILPANTVFVLLAHYNETKFVRLVNLALDVMHEKNAIGLIKSLSSDTQEGKK